MIDFEALELSTIILRITIYRGFSFIAMLPGKQGLLSFVPVPGTSRTNTPMKILIGQMPFRTEFTISDDHSVMDYRSSESKADENDPRKTDTLSNRKVLEQIKNRFRHNCTTKQLIRRLPILNWMQTYSLKSAFCDCMAGVTVALTAIPQGIAYGAVAGVPVEVRMNN